MLATYRLPKVTAQFWRLLRYNGAMATIQVREVPEEVHRTYRARAAAAGMSLTEYLRAELIRNASMLTPAEVADEVDAEIRHEGSEGFAVRSSARIVRADRASH